MKFIRFFVNRAQGQLGASTAAGDSGTSRLERTFAEDYLGGLPLPGTDLVSDLKLKCFTHIVLTLNYNKYSKSAREYY